MHACTTLLRVLAVVLCLAALLHTTAHAVNIKVILPQPDRDWPWKPQLDLPLPDDFFTGAKALGDEDHWRILAHVGAPVRVRADRSPDLMELLELIVFMRNNGQGMCPCYTSPYRVWYFRFHPDELHLLFGEARWAALQRLQVSETWSLIPTDEVGPAVRAAEQAIAQLASPNPPGQIIVRTNAADSNDTNAPRVSLADFYVTVRVVSTGKSMVYKLPQLQVDMDGVRRRAKLHYYAQAKQRFHAKVAAFDEAVVEAQEHLEDAIEELKRQEQAAYDAQTRFKTQYQQFLLDRQRHRQAEKERALAAASADDDAAHNGSRRASFSRLHIKVAAPQATTASEQNAVACRKVHAAWDTLRRNGVRWEAFDGRAVRLQQLHHTHGCPGELKGLHGHRGDTTAGGEEEGADIVGLHPTATRAWRTALAEMMAQRDKSGRAPTFAQLFAVLFHVWQREIAGEQGGSTFADPAPVPPPSEYNGHAFCTFVHGFVESGDAVAVAGGWLPRFIRAELHYFIGILQFAMVDTQNTGPSSSPAEATGSSQSTKEQAANAVRGMLHLYEALGAGSQHAAGALATLREHGIFTRQHSKAAMMLLLRSMKHSTTHMLRELLLEPRHSYYLDEPDAMLQSSNMSDTGGSRETLAAAVEEMVYPDSSRLLRFEQFYAVDHTFSEVDDPFMTRESITTLVAVTNENTHSADEAPELEDVYREAEMERSYGDYEGGITAKLSRRLLKANMLLSGFKDTRRDAQEAQCELLVVLRRLGYVCDLDLHALFSADNARGSNGLAALHSAIGVLLPESCIEHEEELYNVLSNGQHTIVRCPASMPVAPQTQGHLRVDVPTSDTLFAMLQQVLLSLSYLHLLHTHEYDLSHMYASLALEMSLRLQRRLLQRIAQVQRSDAHHHHHRSREAAEEADREAAGSSGNHSILPAYDALAELADAEDKLAWAAERLLNSVEALEVSDDKNAASSSSSGAAAAAAGTRGHASSLDERVQRVLQRLRTVADSPFVETEALMLLGVTRWAKRGPLSATAARVPEFEARLSQWTMEPFQLLGSFLDPAAQRHAKIESSATELKELRPGKGRETSSADPRHHGGRAAGAPSEPLDVHAVFLLCLAAMKRWKGDFPAVHLLDTTSYSVRRTDPFVMASFLLHATDPDTGAPLLSIAKLRDVVAAASPQFLGDTPHFMPLVDDTVETYAARLLRFAAHHIHALEPSVELLRSGAYAVGAMPSSAAATAGSGGGGGATAPKAARRHAAFDDAPPRRSRLRTLRRAKQQTMENAELQPLLYASDVHDYYNQSRWTYMGTALSAVYNALLYPFTYTTGESVLAEMETRLQFIEPQERRGVVQAYLTPEGENAADGREWNDADAQDDAQAAEETSATGTGAVSVDDDDEETKETTSVSAFVDVFAKSTDLREHFIACQLFSFTLESGMPEGFSLMLYEATNRGNAHLSHLVQYLSDSVFARWTASVWSEHHLSAQWQREKTRVPFDTALFSLNTRSPFRYASIEARQELFARLGRYRAARALEETQPPNSTNPTKRSSTSVSAARDALLWCAGFVTRQAYKGSAVVHPFGYEGAVFPAADAECVAELNQLMAMRSSAMAANWTLSQWREAQANGTQLLRDLADRLAYDYDLTEALPKQRFALSENDYQRNTSELATSIRRAESQNTYRTRFARVSTQLVEPWNRHSREISTESLKQGEGVYYNGRLHRVSGYRWGATLQSWWLWARCILPW